MITSLGATNLGILLHENKHLFTVFWRGKNCGVTIPFVENEVGLYTNHYRKPAPRISLSGGDNSKNNTVYNL
jgi:hypothetical protein